MCALRCRAGIEQEWRRRAQGYEPKLSKSTKPPSWNKITLHDITRHKDDGSNRGALSVKVGVEISRQKIAARDAYLYVGQRAQLHCKDQNSDQSRNIVTVDLCSSPFEDSLNWLPLYKLRGDVPTGSTRTKKSSLLNAISKESGDNKVDRNDDDDECSVTGFLELFFPDENDPSNALVEKLLATQKGEDVKDVEIGPFLGNGYDFRRLHGIFMFRKILMFAQRSHMHLVKSCIEDQTPHGLDLPWREENRLYYILDGEKDEDKHVLFQKDFDKWEKQFNTKVRLAKMSLDGNAAGNNDNKIFDGTIEELFEYDDLEYYPQETGVIIFGDTKFVQRVRTITREAEIPETNVLDILTNVRTRVKILRSEAIDSYCPPDKRDEIPDFEDEIRDQNGSLV